MKTDSRIEPTMSFESDCKHAFQMTIEFQVSILEGNRDVVVKMGLNVPIQDLRWEGRGDRLLFIWKDSRCSKRSLGEKFRLDPMSAAFACTVSLPCDVDFSRALMNLSGSHLIMRFPKQKSYLAEMVGRHKLCHPQGGGAKDGGFLNRRHTAK